MTLRITFWNNTIEFMVCLHNVKLMLFQTLEKIIFWQIGKFPGNERRIKGSPDPSHFMFEINVGILDRIRYRTAPNFEWRRFNRFWKLTSFKLRVVLSRNRLFPKLISKIKWLVYELPLRVSLKLDEFSSNTVWFMVRKTYSSEPLLDDFSRLANKG